jgi:hypothetical protein
MPQRADGCWHLRYVFVMRYPQGGGLTAERQAFREQLRMEAAEGFGTGEDNADIATQLRVHVRSVQRWRSAWAAWDDAALVSKGPTNHPQLTDEQFAVLEVELARCPAVHGWPDQKWTLSLTLSGPSTWRARLWTSISVDKNAGMTDEIDGVQVAEVLHEHIAWLLGEYSDADGPAGYAEDLLPADRDGLENECRAFLSMASSAGLLHGTSNAVHGRLFANSRRGARGGYQDAGLATGDALDLLARRFDEIELHHDEQGRLRLRRYPRANDDQQTTCDITL